MSTIYSIANKCDWKNKSDLIVIFILTSDKTRYLSHIHYIYRTLQKHKKSPFYFENTCTYWQKCLLGTIFVQRWWSKKYKETWGGGNEGVVEIRVKGAL